MKKKTTKKPLLAKMGILFLSALLALVGLPTDGSAQVDNSAHNELAPPEAEKYPAPQIWTMRAAATGKEAVIWSEDFANGIPANWQNQGFTRGVTGGLTPNAFCLWEYRGPNTTPSNSLGSRGQFAGSGPTIQSLTDTNGFIIFDSDYWDSDGIAGNRGGGVCPAPHVGTLTTDTIDLSNEPNLEVALYSRARQRTSAFSLAISNDGGITFPDTVKFHTSLASNSTSSSGSEVSANISAVAGGQSLVMLRLVFEGLPGASPGLYYWQVDDMELRSLPGNEFKLVEFNGAPPTDIIYPSGSPEYGNPQVDQVQPIGFDANFINFGLNDQYNVRLKVEIEDSTGAVITTLTSPTMDTLKSGDTGNFNDFTVSGTWTPPGVGVYEAFYYVESDSIPALAASPLDSITFRVNEQIHGGHFSTFRNDIGTEQSRLALAQAFTFPMSHPDSGGYALIDGVNIFLSNDTDPGGDLGIVFYESTGFTYGGNGGPNGTFVKSKNFTIDTSDIGGWAYFDFRDNGSPLALFSDSGCYVVITLVPNAPGDEIQIGNDQTISQPSPLKAMQRDDGTWFSSYTNSLAFSNLMLELVIAAEDVSLDENAALQNLAIEIFPQPTVDGKVSLRFNTDGAFDIEITTLNGQRVYRERVAVNQGESFTRDFSELAAGSYLLKATNGQLNFVEKITLK